MFEINLYMGTVIKYTEMNVNKPSTSHLIWCRYAGLRSRVPSKWEAKISFARDIRTRSRIIVSTQLLAGLAAK